MATMKDYVEEENEILNNILNSFEVKRNEEYKNVNNLLILATGSSYNACLSAKPAIERIANISVTIEEPYNFNHYGHLSESVDLVLAVSQSGESASTVNAIKNVKKSGKYTVVITSNLRSPISMADCLIDLNIGTEKVGFVTKGYSATVLQLLLLSINIGYSKSFLSNKEIHYYMTEIEKVLVKIPSIIDKSNEFFEQYSDLLKVGRRFIAIGYGTNWGTAKEFETKFTETVRLPSQGFELEAYMHGPYLEANNEHILFFIDSNSSNSNRLTLLENYMSSHVGKTFIITTEKKNGNNILSLDIDCDEIVSQLALVIPFQIFSYRISESKQIDLSKRIFDDFDSVLKSKIKQGEQRC